MPTSSKRKRRIIVYGSVARYGPQSVCQRQAAELSRRVYVRIRSRAELWIFMHLEGGIWRYVRNVEKNVRKTFKVRLEPR